MLGNMVADNTSPQGDLKSSELKTNGDAVIGAGFPETQFHAAYEVEVNGKLQVAQFDTSKVSSRVEF